MPIWYVNPKGKHLPRATRREQRMYEHIKAHYSSAGSPRAKEIAARTVYARRKNVAKKRPKLAGKYIRKAGGNLAKAWKMQRAAKGSAKRKRAKPVRSAPVRKRRKAAHAAAKRGGVTMAAKRRKGRKSSKRSKAARKAARTRARNKAMRAAASRKGAKARRRKGGGKRRHARRAGWRGRPHSRRRYRVSGKGRKARVHRTNPRRRRRSARRRSYRRNPGLKLGGIGGKLMGAIKTSLPIIAGVLAGNWASKQLAGKVPGMDKLGKAAGPAMSALLLVGGHFATSKIKPLAKWRTGIMTGLGLNLTYSVLKAVVPADLQAKIGLGDAYDEALSDYVEPVGSYLETANYIETAGDIRQELADSSQGAIMQDMGMEQELGRAMLAPIPTRAMLAPIPSKAYVAPVQRWTPSVDSDANVYTGIFAGGW